MKRDGRFATSGEAFDHYHDLAPNVAAHGATIEEKVAWYEQTGEAELARLNAAAPPLRSDILQPRKTAPSPAAPADKLRGRTLEMLLADFEKIAPSDLVPLPSHVVAAGDRFEWYQEIGEAELIRMANRAASALTNELAADRSEIAELDRKISATRDEIEGHRLGTESARAEIDGINALPSIVEFNRLAGEVAACDRRLATVCEQESLLSGFANTMGAVL